MITSKQEAFELCQKYEVNLIENPDTVVTENGNIYLTGKIDPADTGKKFIPEENKKSASEEGDEGTGKKAKK